MKERSEPYSGEYIFQGFPEREEYLNVLRQKVSHFIGQIALFLEGPTLVDNPGIMQMARGELQSSTYQPPKQWEGKWQGSNACRAKAIT